MQSTVRRQPRRGFEGNSHLRRVQLRQIRDVDKPSSSSNAASDAWADGTLAATERPAALADRHRDRAKLLPVVCLKATMGNAAQRHRLVEHRIEHRGEIAGRAVDDLQHLGGRGLLLSASRVS